MLFMKHFCTTKKCTRIF